MTIPRVDPTSVTRQSPDPPLFALFCHVGLFTESQDTQMAFSKERNIWGSYNVDLNAAASAEKVLENHQYHAICRSQGPTGLPYPRNRRVHHLPNLASMNVGEVRRHRNPNSTPTIATSRPRRELSYASAPQNWPQVTLVLTGKTEPGLRRVRTRHRPSLERSRLREIETNGIIGFGDFS